MGLFGFFKGNSNSDVKDKIPQAYSLGDFILTKKYYKGNKTMGGLVLRIEEKVNNTCKCSLGAFTIKGNDLVWVPKRNGNWINVSLLNIERKLTVEQAEELLEQIIIR